jgi:5-methylthioadenosine/S-adenosylhomocysteine deaminase
MDIPRRLLLGSALASPVLMAVPGCAPASAPPATVPHGGLTVIRGARRVVTMDPTLGDVDDADILVENGVISAVGPNLDAAGAEEVNAANRVAIPGFVDTHWHMWNSIARGFGSSAAGGFGPTMKQISGRFTPEDSGAGVRLALAEAISGGITTVHNWAHNVRSAEHADAEIAAMRDAGVRGRFAYGYPQDAAPSAVMDLDHLSATAARWPEGLISLGICARGPDRSDETVWRREWEAARSLGLPITTHQSSTPAEVARGGIAALEAGGGLGPDVQLVHLTAATPDDVARVAAARSAVSISPWSELQVGYGIPPVAALRDAGVRLGLSVDNVVLCGQADMFSVMRLAGDLAAGVARTQLAVPERTVIEWATSSAAESLGLGSSVGSLTPGKRADVVLIRADAVSNTPVRDSTALLVRAARPSDVDFVMIDGVVRKRDGRLVNIDVEALTRDAAERISRIRKEAGI